MIETQVALVIKSGHNVACDSRLSFREIYIVVNYKDINNMIIKMSDQL